MVWTVQEDIILGAGVPRIGEITTTVPQFPLGTIMRGVDPYWGGGEFMLVKSSGAVANGSICVWDVSFTATQVANTTLQGRALGTLVGAFTATGQYGWLQIGGQAYAIANATIAAGTLSGITAAGTSGTLAAGKALLNAMTAAPQTTAVAKNNVVTNNGSNIIIVPGGADGWFVGVTMSGTGLSGTITSIGTDNKTVTLSANASATGVVTATGTYTGFSILSLCRPMAQGPIT